MIAFEVKNGDIMPMVLCDFCHARIVGSGNAIWLMPSPIGKPPRGPNFFFESPVYHTHRHCFHAFELAHNDHHGQTDLLDCDLWVFLAQTLNNAVVSDDRKARRIFDSVKRAVESERKP